MMQYTILISLFLFVHFSEAVDTVEITRDDSSNSLCALLCIAKPSSGEGSLNYVWIENGQFFSTGSNLTVNNSDLSHSYTCNASNPVTWKSTTRKAEDICRGKRIFSCIVQVCLF